MFLDTSVLIEILAGSDEVVTFVEKVAEKEHLMFSVVQVGELADWCYSNKFDPSKVLNKLKNLATVVGITEDICLDGSRIKQKQRSAGKFKFSLIDGLIVASAISFEQKLLTKDGDFEGLEDVIFL